MKKTLVVAMLGLVAVMSMHAQGVVVLYNYDQPATAITYGPGSGGPLATGITGGQWTIGLYAAPTSLYSATTINSLMSGDIGQGLIPLLTLNPSTTTLIPGYPGLFGPAYATIPGAVNASATLVVIVYNGFSYNTSTIRAHSLAFEMTASASPSTPHDVGEFMSSFAIIMPEPSTFALTGLGLASLLIYRRSRANGC